LELSGAIGAADGVHSNDWLGAPALTEAADTAPEFTVDTDLTEGTCAFEAPESRA
jgi:hypothetical protein